MLIYDDYGDGREGDGCGGGVGYHRRAFDYSSAAGNGPIVAGGYKLVMDSPGDGRGMGTNCWAAVAMNVSFETDVYFILFTRGKNHGV